MSELTLSVVQQAVGGARAAFRVRRRLQPAGGAGDNVFPPTFAGAVYAIEQRRVAERDAGVTCVLPDSVQSQPNRMGGIAGQPWRRGQWRAPAPASAADPLVGGARASCRARSGGGGFGLGLQSLFGRLRARA